MGNGFVPFFSYGIDMRGASRTPPPTFRVSYCLMPIAYYLMHIADYLIHIADYPVQITQHAFAFNQVLKLQRSHLFHYITASRLRKACSFIILVL